MDAESIGGTLHEGTADGKADMCPGSLWGSFSASMYGDFDVAGMPFHVLGHNK